MSRGHTADHLRDIANLSNDQKEFLASSLVRDLPSFYRDQDVPADQFLDFCTKYAAVQIRQRSFVEPSKNKDKSKQSAHELELPQDYSDRYRIPFAILTPSLSQSRAARVGLDSTHISELRQAAHMFEDFLQKRRFKAIKKMLSDREQLPIAAYKTHIINTLKTNRVLLIAGDTGCGKSTQVPQYLLQAGYNSIACTQPRRLSCISLCRRVAYENLNEFGQTVRYAVRFDSTRAQGTRLLFLTEGLLLRQMQAKPLGVEYDVIVVDEVHERHLSTDLLLGMLKQMLVTHETLRVVLMSATINLELFQAYFDQCPAVVVPGRLFPIETQNFPDLNPLPKAPPPDRPHVPQGQTAPKFIAANIAKLLMMIDTKFSSKERGDVLIFLSGTYEISKCQEECQEYATTSRKWIILPLHSQLPVEEQDKVFDIAPEGVRKCILSTNIAETSITIDGVRFVVDTGRQKEMAQSFQGLDGSHQWLVDKWISKASAEQRKGRAGRTGPGFCFRLYKPEYFQSFPDFALAEIHRCALEGALLTLLSLGQHPNDFQFVDKPSEDRMTVALQRLRAIGCASGAVDSVVVTRLGKVLATLPLEPNVGRMVVVGAFLGLTEPTLTVAAALSVQTPFSFDSKGVSTGARSFGSSGGGNDDAQDDELALSSDAQSGADAFWARDGDAHTLLRLFDEWLTVKAEKGRGSVSWCKRKGVIEERMYEMAKVRRQLVDIIGNGRLKQLGAWDSEQQDESDPEDRSNDRRNNSAVDAKTKEEQRRTRRELRKLQRRHNHQTGRRVLSVDALQAETIDSEESNKPKASNDRASVGIDMRHLDFRLMYSVDDLVAGGGGNLSGEEALLMTFVVACGLYPNIAFGEEANMSRNDSEKVFTTASWQQAYMHPSSVLASNPASAPQQVAAWPQVLVFSKLLTTTKTYVVNCTRLFAPLQYLVLLSPFVDVSADCSVIVIDHWLRFQIAPIAQPHVPDFLVVASQLRAHLNALLSGQLTRAGFENTVDSNDKSATTPSNDCTVEATNVEQTPEQTFVQAMQSHHEKLMTTDWTVVEFSAKLSDFVRLHVDYKMEMIPKAHVPAHFVLKESSSTAEELAEVVGLLQRTDTPANTLERMHKHKTGARVDDWAVIGSVRPVPDMGRLASDCMSVHYTCDICSEHFIFNRTQLAAHKKECAKAKKKRSRESSNNEPEATSKKQATTQPSASVATATSTNFTSVLRGSRLPPEDDKS